MSNEYLIVEGSMLCANKTTLGADNGCAVAMMLTLLDKDDLVHPPLECLFTAQEETGLDGAKYFDLSKIDSRRVIGLDAGSEGVFCKGTTTKIQMTSALKAEREKAEGKIYDLVVEGLRGGDQGANIPKERICAVKMTSRALHHLNKEMDMVTTAATYEDYHTPNEHLYMDSFEKVYYLLERTLFNLT